MSSLWWNVLMVLYCMECVLALSLNVFILVMNGKILNNRTKQNPSTVIQVTMAVTNITMRILMLIQFMALLFPNLRLDELYYIMFVFLSFKMYISNWLVSWLCAYYCVSIVTFTHQVIVWVRRILSSWLQCGLVLSAVGCVALSVPSIWYFDITVVYMEDNNTFPYSSDMQAVPLSHTYTVISKLLGLCLPFNISFLSLMTTVVPLFRHVRNIGKQGSGFSPAKVHAHVNAIRTIILLLILSVTFNITGMIMYSYIAHKNLWMIVCWFLVNVFPTLEAATIIQSSSRLSALVLGRLCAWRGVKAEG